MAARLFALYTSSPPSILIKAITPTLSICPMIKRYYSKESKGGSIYETARIGIAPDEELKKKDPYEFIGERATSTAEEFKRRAAEMLKEAEQGLSSIVIDKALDAAEEATLGGDDLQSIKNRYKEHETGADYRRRG